MHDHLGGGFHRYSVDAQWHVPHFEKMLYDQAQLAQVYLTAYQISGDQTFARTSGDILQYVARDLTSAEGGFFSAEDADSLPRPDAVRKTEGAFYIWKSDEISEVLGADRLAEFSDVYGVDPEGNVSLDSDPHGELEGENVLIQRQSIAEAAAHFQRPLTAMESRLDEDRALLLARRNQRPHPHLDDKILTAWNGLMIGAFARAARVLDDAVYLGTAQCAALFIKKNVFDPASGELRRSFREGPSPIHAFAADYAFLISGLLDLYETDFDLDWLRWARELQDTLDLHFWDQHHGGYYSTSDRDPAILLRLKEDYDGAEPTPTSVAVHNLRRFGRLFHNEVLISHAQRAITSFAPRLEAQPFAMPLLLTAAAMLDAPPMHLILHSPAPDHPGLAALLTEARRRYLPQLTVIRIADEESRAFFGPRHHVVENLPGPSRNRPPTSAKTSPASCPSPARSSCGSSWPRSDRRRGLYR